MKIGVMQGTLQEFDLATVLQVVGLGRQYTGVEVRLEDGRKGTVYVKAGKVVQVESDELSGPAALTQLFALPRGDFFVFRSDTPENLPDPVGSLGQLVLQAQRSTASSLPPAKVETPTATPAPSIPAKEPVHVPRSPSVSAMQAVSTTKLAKAARKEGTSVIGIASPKGGCGKSTIALNLALSLARRGNSVCLVDADINGDILSTLNSRAKANAGALDVITQGIPLADAVLDTALPHFKIVPAVGQQLPSVEALESDHTEAWRQLLGDASKLAEVVIVDTPAGMFGPTRQVLASCSHVLGVLQAEAVAERSFQRFRHGLQALGDAAPDVLGVVLNMLQTRHAASLTVFQNACSAHGNDWLFDTTIPRHPAFLDAALEGSPMRRLNDDAPAAVGFLFDNLASEVAERIPLTVSEPKSQSLIL